MKTIKELFETIFPPKDGMEDPPENVMGEMILQYINYQIELSLSYNKVLDLLVKENLISQDELDAKRRQIRGRMHTLEEALSNVGKALDS